jgi:hypothetical protein
VAEAHGRVAANRPAPVVTECQTMHKSSKQNRGSQMHKRKLLILLAIGGWVLSACGGGEPTPVPTPQPTFTPTAAPTNTPAATEAPPSTPTAAPTATLAATPAAETVAAPESPLPAPESPLPAPAAAAPTPPPPPAAERITGYWQLEKVLRADGAEPLLADPSLFRLALWRTGTAAVLADCSTGRGRIIPGEGEELRFALAFSESACAPDSLSGPFMRSLEATSAFTLTEGKLGLYYGNAMNQLLFAPVPIEYAANPNTLAWSRIQNTTFSVEGPPAGDNQAPLMAGQFIAPLEAGSDTYFVVTLSPLRAYGDLDGDELLDLVVLLKVEPGDGSARFYLAPVLNIGNGLPLPLPGELLGNDVQLHDLAIDDKQVKVAFTADGAAPLQRTYTLENNVLAIAAEAPLAVVPTAAELAAPVRDITLAADGTPFVLTGTLPFSGTQALRIAGTDGQPLSATVASTYGDVWLSVHGEADNVILRAVAAEDSAWSGVLPTTQNYLVTLYAMGSSTPYTVTLSPALAPPPATP